MKWRAKKVAQFWSKRTFAKVLFGLVFQKSAAHPTFGKIVEVELEVI